MASAVLVSRNEPYWGERKVYMRKNPNSNPQLRPNAKSVSNPNRQIYDCSNRIHCPQGDDSVVSEDSSSLNRKSIYINNRKDPSLGGYVTFNIGAYSRIELKELKKRLMSELEQVRALNNHIELKEIESRSSHRGRESTYAMRPPALHFNSSSYSPGADEFKEKQTPKTDQLNRPKELVTGKGRMIPQDIKKALGSKRPLQSLSWRNAKRPATGNLLQSLMKCCRQILTTLMRHKHSWVFKEPVDIVKMGLHDYHQIIKHPMDLGTVKSKLHKNLYASPLDFASDVRLIFNNALVYNPKGHEVHSMAEALLSLFEEMFVPTYGKLEDEQRPAINPSEETRRSSWNGMPSPENLKQPSAMAVSHTPKPTPVPGVKPLMTTSKQAKPKAKDPNKREMTLEEKQRLSTSLRSFPHEKMDQVVQIVRKRNPNLVQDGDEIELDLQVIDTETLWELDRFSYNFKKTMSKMKRQGISMTQSGGNKSPLGYMLEDTVGTDSAKKNKGEECEEDVDIGDDIPTNNFPPIEIAGCGSSSSSSTSNSSSSSDSESGNSSGSESDANDAESPHIQSRVP